MHVARELGELDFDQSVGPVVHLEILCWGICIFTYKYLVSSQLKVGLFSAVGSAQAEPIPKTTQTALNNFILNIEITWIYCQGLTEFTISPCIYKNPKPHNTTSTPSFSLLPCINRLATWQWVLPQGTIVTGLAAGISDTYCLCIPHNVFPLVRGEVVPGCGERRRRNFSRLLKLSGETYPLDSHEAAYQQRRCQ